MILLDTHVVLWYLDDDKRIGRKAMATIERTLPKGEAFASAISFWEVAMLIGKGRIDVGTTASVFRTTVLRHGIEEQPIDGPMAIAAAELSSHHLDPADRLIVATALISGFTLITADQTILDWNLRGLKKQDATD